MVQMLYMADILQEHHSAGFVIRQRMLASTISAYSRASRPRNEDAELDVWHDVV